ncbi:hypothetical protein LRP49_04930 [Enterovibrio sp. ZSDZ35]|uniref:Uncharacterized protein n=1 Tax=Enterovibrio qingdaonensis TaxID=2899818 RepID=A0ABT5QJ89_9GAMM|nr:hypothetical protein [Enterovibrio sp. ZSDZ35]MDD1780540.1 hypothetical protein [Enterovibrio sp. ZSDZ35]
MTDKSRPMESITNIKVGGSDSVGNKIKNVLATNNEFAIYEIEHDDINSKIRVLIDGYTDESERKMQNRFHRVKQKYIEAKGLLAIASNYEMMKHRIAHTLSSCLSCEDIEGNDEFDKLIKQINQEHGRIVENRALYLLPCLLAVVVLFLVSLVNMPLIFSGVTFAKVMLFLLATSLGCGLSMLITARKLNFDEFTAKSHYLLLGVERWLFSSMAGATAYVLIKSNIAFPDLDVSNVWVMMAILLLSGFSESFIPSVLSNLNKAKT